MKFYTNREEDLKVIAKEFKKLLNDHKVFAFAVEMAVGKTTFISYLAKELGVKEQVNSPTFGYVNQYFSEKFGTIYHFDLYRISDEEEAYDIGIEEYIYDENIVFLEWSENIEKLLPENHVK